MRLVFEKDGKRTVIPREKSQAEFDRITGRSAMAVVTMKGGIPVSLDGGEYRLVNEDLSDISEKNFL